VKSNTPINRKQRLTRTFTDASAAAQAARSRQGPTAAIKGEDDDP
jgi:hypothetical protein